MVRKQTKTLENLYLVEGLRGIPKIFAKTLQNAKVYLVIESLQANWVDLSFPKEVATKEVAMTTGTSQKKTLKLLKTIKQ